MYDDVSNWDTYVHLLHHKVLLKELVQSSTLLTKHYHSYIVFFSRPTPSIYKVDHHYPGSSNNPVAVILYGDVSNWDTYVHSFHKVLKKLAKEGEINYILRHYIKVGTILTNIFWDEENICVRQDYNAVKWSTLLVYWLTVQQLKATHYKLRK